MPSTARDYALLAERVAPDTAAPGRRDDRMQEIVDAAWELLGSRSVSWIGFYLKEPNQDLMVLGPRRDKPACSPIGLHGMCGRCWKERAPVIVDDVATLGAGYIACDPRDRSELVLPLLEADGSCWGVLDADSYDIGSFGDADVAGLARVLERAGLSGPILRPTLRL
jgi:putative methionine-R-sulfoxide reductase with GAF domain